MIASPRSKKPDKGSFPLDHFQECKEEAEAYQNCLKLHDNFPKKCRSKQKAFFVCRMDK